MIGTNQPEWLYTYFAASKIGATVVALNVRYRDVELEYMLNQSETKVLVTITDLAGFDYTAFFDSFRKKIPTVTDFVFIPSLIPPRPALSKTFEVPTPTARSSKRRSTRPRFRRHGGPLPRTT